MKFWTGMDGLKRWNLQKPHAARAFRVSWWGNVQNYDVRHAEQILEWVGKIEPLIFPQSISLSGLSDDYGCAAVQNNAILPATSLTH
ncbi:hypothetical protein ACEV6Q_27180 [Enterobacter ludwigii]|uniref:hypothetical protein n=1 Tax=Enterobacter ludwigii TaxID=299767 RepID=UPI003BEF377E